MRKRLFSLAAAVSVAVVSMVSALQAAVVSFGTGTNVFQMEFVKIGNPGNAADSDPNARPVSATLGSVGYEYGIGKFEVSEGMITKYNASFGTANGLVITTTMRGANKPAAVSWNQAARFVNWLNTSTGRFAAYKFTTSGVNDDIALWTEADTLDYDPLNRYRSKRATYVLPSYNEWYKAAYYNPNDSTYYDFPNGSNTRPTAVTSGTAANTAVYTRSGEASPTGPADVDKAGGLSPYGVMGLGGNIFEWEESSFDLSNSSSSSSRGVRGGDWFNNSSFLPSSTRLTSSSTLGTSVGKGFRVTSLSSSAPPAVPEPSMMMIGTLFGLGGLVAKWRMKK